LPDLCKTYAQEAVSKAWRNAPKFFICHFFSRKTTNNNWPFGQTMVFENASRVLIVNCNRTASKSLSFDF
ncbi:hypothetical protein ACCT32_35975, partial [Rhizobium brockwellii]|uniref:hypothetical protein n=1 Tax=Rhizobium brockwellii TaxID=3019932 RepID=UPI003F99FAAE